MDDDTIHELFATLQPITIRRMFGGKGIYADGRICALVLNDELYLKTDCETASRFEAAGARRWTYQREGAAPVAMPYHTVPDEALDDPDIMAGWARLAMGAAIRHGMKKPPGRVKHPAASRNSKTVV
ncbi:TfoX/Sxy family protein [Aureimonas sp. Leaf324]|uniref:TfoX/Sxy family protein n=1 Tax=Aureimonas sp. Leaf324 TaxID=1736336 RepID=UPI0006F4FF81|nr:TfoX/Sxy family protein [Aureimonas sp. Leaf324]KQQ91487.1 competence protein TfoX [Aureimonas sp. Leaf324]